MRVDVEPLDDERLTNIERRIVLGAQPAPPPRRWGEIIAATIAACTIAAAAGVVGWTLHRDDTVVADEPKLAIHDAHVDIGDAIIDATPDTSYVVTRPGGGVLVEMTRGRVELEVGKRHGRPPLVVRAGDTDVIVVGTHFTVDMRSGTVDVQVTEGVVRVLHQQHEERVARGQQWHDGVVAAAPVVAASADAPPTETPNPSLLHDRVAAVPDAPALPAPVAPRPRELGAPSLVVRPTVSQHPSTPLEQQKADIRAIALAPPLDVGLEANAAMARYREIATTTTRDQAAHALYSMAVVQHTKLGRDADALRSLDQYLARFENASDYIAALWLRVRITCLRRVDDACRQAAYTYINKAPDDEARHVARVLTTTE